MEERTSEPETVICNAQNRPVERLLINLKAAFQTCDFPAFLLAFRNIFTCQCLLRIRTHKNAHAQQKRNTKLKHTN